MAAIMDELSNLRVNLSQSVEEVGFIKKRIQGPMNNGNFETTMWELTRMEENAAKWLMQLKDALDEVLKQIHSFKSCQQGKRIGHVETINLDEVQKHCDSLEWLLGQLYYLVNTSTDCLASLGQRFGENHPNHEFQQMKDIIEKLGHKLLQSSIIIEQQPQQVIRTNQCFKASVRLLLSCLHDKVIPPSPQASNSHPKVAIEKLGHKLLQSSIIIEQQPQQVIRTNQCFKASVRLLLSCLHDKVIPPSPQASNSHPKVAVYLLYEPQALELQIPFSIETIKHNQWKQVKSKGDTGCFQYDENTKRLTANFTKLFIEKVTRSTVRGNEDKVAEEKCTLLFLIQGADLQQLQTLSLPIAITVHVSQEIYGEATIFWDNAFRRLAYCPHFVQPCTRSECIQAFSSLVPVKVPWFRLASILRMYFKMKVDCDLSDDDIEHLRDKIFSVSSPKDGMVTWKDFAKEPLPQNNPFPAGSTLTKFTFWEWFRGLIKLMEQHDGVIAKMWRNKLIRGLITSSTSLRLLSGYPDKTFVLRPSSVPEYFNADVLEVKNPKQPNQQRRERLRVISYISKVLPNKSLADWALEVDDMEYLLPSTSSLAHPKRTVLAEYIKKGKEATVALPYGYEVVVTVCKVSKTPDPAEGNGSDMPPNQRTTDSADSMHMETETVISSGNFVASPEYKMEASSIAHPTTSVCSPQSGFSAYSPQPGSGVFSHQSIPTTNQSIPIAHPGMNSMSEYSSELGPNTFSPYSDTNAFSSQPGSSAFSPQSVSSAFSPQSGSTALSPQPGSSAFSPQPGSSAFSPQPGSSVCPPQSGSFVSSPQPETTVSPRSVDYTSIQHNINGLSTGFSNLEVSFGSTVSMLPSDSNSPVPGNQNLGSISTEQHNMFGEIPPSVIEDIFLLDDALLQ